MKTFFFVLCAKSEEWFAESIAWEKWCEDHGGQDAKCVWQQEEVDHKCSFVKEQNFQGSNVWLFSSKEKKCLAVAMSREETRYGS